MSNFLGLRFLTSCKSHRSNFKQVFFVILGTVVICRLGLFFGYLCLFRLKIKILRLSNLRVHLIGLTSCRHSSLISHNFFSLLRWFSFFNILFVQCDNFFRISVENVLSFCVNIIHIHVAIDQFFKHLSFFFTEMIL